MDNDLEYIKKQLADKLAMSADNRRLAYYKLNSSLIIVSATIFSIVISINLFVSGTPVVSPVVSGNTHSYDMVARYLLSAGILVNGFHILAAALLLYSEAKYHNLYVDKVVASINKLVATGSLGNTKLGNTYIEDVDLPEYYKRVQKLSYILFSSMVVFYMIYAILKQFN